METSQDTEETVENEKNTVGYWRRWLTSSKKAAKKHFSISREAWDEFEDAEIVSNLIDRNPVSKRAYQVYWSATDTLLPALYAKTPDLTSKRAFGVDDEVGLVACTIKERLADYHVRQTDFDSVAQKAVLDYIHTDKACIQLIYNAEFEDVEERVKIEPDPQGDPDLFFDAQGEIYEGEVFQDDQGYFGLVTRERPTTQSIGLANALFDEVLHTPHAKSQSEVEEWAGKFFMTKEAAIERFPSKIGSIIWKTGAKQQHDSDETESKEVDIVGEYLEGWEIWCKTTKTVYWVSDQYQDDFLDKREDPYGLKDFSPFTAFIIGSPHAKSLYPTPIYQRLKPTITQLHKLAARISKLIDSVKRRALVDGADDELIYALNSLSEGEFVAVKNLSALLEKGGIQNKVWYVPVQDLVQAIGELVQLEQKFAADFDLWFGVPDILRGGGDALETATGQSLRANAAHNRFKFKKKQIATMLRDAIEMMVDLALGVYDDDTIQEIIGYRFLDEEERAVFGEALQLARDDTSGAIRLEVDTESLSFVDEQREAAMMNQAVQTLTSGLSSISQMMQLNPQLGAVGLHALLESLESITPGRQFQGEVKQTVESMIEAAMNPEEEEPQPDIDMLKLQLDKSKSDADFQIKSAKIQIDDNKAKFSQAIEAARLELDKYKAATEARITEILTQLEQQTVAIENFKAQAQVRESYMEEVRLAKEVDARMIEAQQPKPENSPDSVVNVNIPPAPQPAIIPVPVAQPEPEPVLIPDLPIDEEPIL